MSLWIDVTTMAMCSPPWVGIPRVESNLAEHLCRLGRDVRTCIYEAQLGRFSELPLGEFMRLAQLRKSTGVSGGTLELQVHRHDRAVAGGAGIFDRGDALISCGLNWRPDFGNMGRLYAFRNAIGLRLVTMCYDIIPLKFTDLVPGMEAIFRPYLRDMVRHADHILCISRCTRHDLLQWAASQGERTPETSVIPLGCELSAHVGERVGEVVARVLGQRFLLSVGTIEDRKNQRALYLAYATLIDSGARELPLMVFAGGAGEGGQALLDEIAADRRMAGKIVVLPEVSDAELIALYDGCLFTLYASLYEGWGLPVSESLARGKFCLASNRASLPEAGGAFADYADPTDVGEWARRIDHYLRVPQALIERELAIREGFTPRRWQDSAAHVMEILSRPRLHRPPNRLRARPVRGCGRHESAAAPPFYGIRRRPVVQNRV